MNNNKFKYLKQNVLECNSIKYIIHQNYISPFFDSKDIQRWIYDFNEAFNDIDIFLNYYNDSLICPFDYEFDDIKVHLRIYDKGLIQNHLNLDDIKLDYTPSEMIDEKTIEIWRLICKEIIERDNISLKENEEIEIKLLSADFVIYLINYIGLPDKEKKKFRDWIYLCVMPSVILR